ncbi:MAG: hypothetical protein EOP38_05220 [Rubrivivax sp.]|nr:MAG: hypothetical protein EOP38_05220 [Rubrivivax sp.]
MDLQCDDRVRIDLALETLSRTGQLTMRALGSSMLPAILAGDLLTFRACTPHMLAPGHVVLARRGDALVAHRLLSCDGALLRLQGDALPCPDLPIATSDLLGVLVRQERAGQLLPLGGRPWLRRHRLARWVLRRSTVARRACRRWPRLSALAA